MTELLASVDVGGTNIKYAFAGADGKIVAESKTPTLSHEGPERVLERIGAEVRALAKRAGQAPAALGMGLPGLLDMDRGVSKFLPNLHTNWRDVSVRELLAPKAGCEVYILNDVRMATLGELTYGHGRTVRTMLFFALGTGIGGGVVVDGALRLGPVGAAGELGHQTILPDGPLCGCGNRGCLETLASAPALTGECVRLMLSGQSPRLHAITEGHADRVNPFTIEQAARADDGAVREAIARVARFLGIGIANLVTALHPELVVIGGGMAEMGDLLFDPVRETVRQRVRMFDTDSVAIKPSQLRDRAGILGGIALAARRGIRQAAK